MFIVNKLLFINIIIFFIYIVFYMERRIKEVEDNFNQKLRGLKNKNTEIKANEIELPELKNDIIELNRRLQKAEDTIENQKKENEIKSIKTKRSNGILDDKNLMN